MLARSGDGVNPREANTSSTDLLKSSETVSLSHDTPFLMPHSALILAGFADKNASLFRRFQVPLGDPAAWVDIHGHTIALVRDLEMDRVRQKSHADHVTCPAEHIPPLGLSADRETATAQATVQLLRSKKIETVITDRSLPFLFAWHLQQAEIEVRYDEELGVLDRRTKSDQEIEALAKAQSVTEEVMLIVLRRIAGAKADAEGRLSVDGEVLTSEGLQSFAAMQFLQRGFSMGHGAIIATVPQVADCHHSGSGAIYTRHPVVVDLFPRDESSRYNGDCTRTIVHGQASQTVEAMHAAVVEAKLAAESKLVAGNLASDVHKASEETLKQHGYPTSRGTITDAPSIQHGTGHGIGLDVHEPILLDEGGGEMLEGEVFTVEPGLYGRTDGGVRVEDMLVVTEGEPRTLNRLPFGLDWS
ncbi:M24 family metallopeptidase [Novipirellula artificiosorum]|uniref:Aminopeptidase n=1 Tax=Novipirellula artificiosorum TaxID=2528016 RepID=A0A5C6DAS2_9BACT|nr:M24 family metallopeptidase [Novipirellula artificiosorum]TWU32894.1 Aminopeptidase [Novipirellula artificiosorum]